MKFVRTAQFENDFKKLPREHRVMFRRIVFDHFIPALEAGAHCGKTSWPKRLRIHKIRDVYSLTWSFSSPDGRALFTFTVDETSEEPLVTWLAVGSHDIYKT